MFFYMVVFIIIGCGNHQKWIYLTINIIAFLIVCGAFYEIFGPGKLIDQKFTFYKGRIPPEHQNERDADILEEEMEEFDHSVLAAPTMLLIVSLTIIWQFVILFVEFKHEAQGYYICYGIFGMVIQFAAGRIFSDKMWARMPTIGRIYRNRCCDKVSYRFVKWTTASNERALNRERELAQHIEMKVPSHPKMQSRKAAISSTIKPTNTINELRPGQTTLPMSVVIAGNNPGLQMGDSTPNRPVKRTTNASGSANSPNQKGQQQTVADQTNDNATKGVNED